MQKEIILFFSRRHPSRKFYSSKGALSLTRLKGLGKYW